MVSGLSGFLGVMRRFWGLLRVRRQTQPLRLGLALRPQRQPETVLAFVEMCFYRLVREQPAQLFNAARSELTVAASAGMEHPIYDCAIVRAFSAAGIAPIAGPVHVAFMPLRLVCKTHQQVMPVALQFTHAPRQQERKRHTVIAAYKPAKFNHRFAPACRGYSEHCCRNHWPVATEQPAIKVQTSDHDNSRRSWVSAAVVVGNHHAFRFSAAAGAEMERRDRYRTFTWQGVPARGSTFHYLRVVHIVVAIHGKCTPNPSLHRTAYGSR